MPQTETHQGTVRQGESSIRISASLLITVIIAILAGNWGLFMMYMDSQSTGIAKSIEHTNQSFLLEIKSVVKSVEANKDTILINRHTLSNLTDRITGIEKELSSKLSDRTDSIHLKMDTRYIDMLNRFVTLEKWINQIEAKIPSPIYRDIDRTNEDSVE